LDGLEGAGVGFEFTQAEPDVDFLCAPGRSRLGAFKPPRTSIVGGDVVTLSECLTTPVGYWLRA
jgi:hypothetical protein